MKLSLNFLNKWESSIFSKYTTSHSPISSLVAKITMYTAITAVLMAFLMQMFGASTTKQENVLGGILIVGFLLVAYQVYKNIGAFSTIGIKIGFAAYILLSYTIFISLFITLASWALMLALAALVLWLVLTVMTGGSGKSKDQITVHYNDGTSEKMKKTGNGMLGETYYESEDGQRNYVDP